MRQIKNIAILNRTFIIEYLNAKTVKAELVGYYSPAGLTNYKPAASNFTALKLQVNNSKVIELSFDRVINDRTKQRLINVHDLLPAEAVVRKRKK